MKSNLYLTILLLSVATLIGCSRTAKNHFVVEGTITEATGKVLYLEGTSSEEVQLLDSVTLTEAGSFSFTREGYVYPMFYRLRLGEESIPFAADSLTHLRLEASGKKLFDSYRIAEDKGGYNEQIRQISRLRLETDRKIESFVASLPTYKITAEGVQLHIDSLVRELKGVLTNRYIYPDPKSPAAYFALLQTYRGGGYFSVEDPEDAKVFAAVATAYDTFYPTAPYTALLKETALVALAQQRAYHRALNPDTTTGPKPYVVDYPEIKLRDQSGREVSLTETASHGPVLVSFTAYSQDWSPELVAELRALHEAHPEITIYEIALDRDAYFWKNATRTLPWISVHDPSGSTLATYNVQQLPAFFSIRGSDLKRLSSPAEMIK